MARSGARPLVVINSGAYVEDELAAEFGLLPPAFLPVGVTRLYELQARMLADLDGELILTVPESFVVPAWDVERLAALEITVLPTPDAYSLGGALLATLGRAGFEDRPLRLLHGDTLLWGLDTAQENVIAVADGGDGYRWSFAELGADERIAAIHRAGVAGSARPGLSLRVCGYFAFATVRTVAAALAISAGDFFKTLNLLCEAATFTPARPERWLDFGHMQTFFRSRRIATTQRSFNHLEIGEMHVRKSSDVAAGKLRNEARWLAELPPALQPFSARLLSQGETAGGFFYETEYEYFPTLAELFVFGRLSRGSWASAMASCSTFIDVAVAAAKADGRTQPGCFRQLVVTKAAARLRDYAATVDLDLNAAMTINGRLAPSLQQCLDRIAAIVADSREIPAIMHGDLCFSNILYSFRMERIRLIDPRATDESGTFSLYGDARYDLAKLMHSICGRYDLIIAGQYSARRLGRSAFELSFPQDAGRDVVAAIARETTMAGVRLTSPEIWAAMISLFLSMPPLHADRPDRQIAFIANALRLVLELEELA